MQSGNIVDDLPVIYIGNNIVFLNISSSINPNVVLYVKFTVERKFTKYVDQAKRESVGKTTEDVLDRVAELLRENNEI